MTPSSVDKIFWLHKKTLKSNERIVMKLQHTNLNHNARAGIWKASRARDKIWSHANLRTFAPIVSAHPYCARNSLRDVMPRHALSARAVEEMWRYIALVGTLISMHGFNSLKCSVTPYFLLIDHFLCRLSTFCEKLKKICIVEVWFFSTFLPSHHRILLLLKLHGVR